MIDYYRQEQTTTVVRHVVAAPVNWAEVQKLLRVVIHDMGVGAEPPDDAVWYEVGDDELVICYRLTDGTTGGPSNSEPLR